MVIAEAVATRQAWVGDDDPVRQVVVRSAARLGLAIGDAVELASRAPDVR